MRRALPLVFLAVTACAPQRDPGPKAPRAPAPAAGALSFDSGWRFQAHHNAITQEAGAQTLELRGGYAWLEQPFTEGTIEFDMGFTRETAFAGAIWHASSDATYEKFYIRPFLSGSREAAQYTPVFNDVAGWQLYHGPGYNGRVDFPRDNWVHVKIAVAGDQAEVFVEDMQQPVVQVADLRLDEDRGDQFALFVEPLPPSYSQAIIRYRNVTVDPTVPTLSQMQPEPAVFAPPTWMVSEPFPKAERPDAFKPELARDAETWTAVPTETTGLANLARAHGVTKQNDTALARVTLVAEQPLRVRMDFGFSEEVRVYLDGEAIYEGSDIWHDHDITFQGVVGHWDTLFLDLDTAGEHELWVAVTENADMRSGWGFLSRFEQAPGLSFRAD